MLSDLNLARETANNLESSIMKSVSETCHLPNNKIFGSSSISNAVNLLHLTCVRAEQANAKNEKSKSAVASNNAATLHHLMNGNLPMPSVVAMAEMAKKSQVQQNRQTASDPVSNLNPAANPVSNSLSNPPSNLSSNPLCNAAHQNPLCNAARQDPSKVLPTKKDTGKVPSSPTHMGSMSPKPTQQSQVGTACNVI